MGENDVTYYVLKIPWKPWQRYTKKEKERLNRKPYEPDQYACPDATVFPPNDPLSFKRFRHPLELTPKERREIIIRYLALGLIRLVAEREFGKQRKPDPFPTEKGTF